MVDATHAVQHIFSVDVEEYFQVSAFDGTVSPDSWESMPSRVEASTDLLLELLSRHGTHATFFVLGWVAKRHPALVRRIADAGHEIASHGWSHRRVTSLEPEEFRRELHDSKQLLEEITGAPCVGYRAPSFSIVPGLEWAFDVLIDEGYQYDSSLFPIKRRGYGYETAPSVPHVVQREHGTLLEFPPATTIILGRRVAAGGGGWFRQLPFALTRRAFRDHRDFGIPATFYIHPWEVDPGQPRLDVSVVTRIRHYRGLSRTLARLERLLSEFAFTSVARSLQLSAPRHPAPPLAAAQLV